MTVTISIVQPQYAPAPTRCVTCGASDKALILFDTNQLWYGALEMCIPCYRSIALTFPAEIKLIDEATLTYVSEANKLLSERLENFDTAVAEYRIEQNDALDRFYRYLDRDATGKPVSVEPSTESVSEENSGAKSVSNIEDFESVG